MAAERPRVLPPPSWSSNEVRGEAVGGAAKTLRRAAPPLRLAPAPPPPPPPPPTAIAADAFHAVAVRRPIRSPSSPSGAPKTSNGLPSRSRGKGPTPPNAVPLSLARRRSEAT